MSGLLKLESNRGNSYSGKETEKFPRKINKISLKGMNAKDSHWGEATRKRG